MQRFVTDEPFLAWLGKRPLRLAQFGFVALFCLGFTAWAFTSSHPLVALGPLAMLALTVIALPWRYLANRSVAVLDGHLLFVPARNFDWTYNLFSPAEGYFCAPSQSLVFVVVEVSNVSAVWRLTDAEAEVLRKGPQIPRDELFVGSPVGVELLQLGRAQSAHARNPGDAWRQMILESFAKRLVHDPSRTVGLRIKHLAPSKFGLSLGTSNAWPTFEDVTVHVSLKDPDALIHALRAAGVAD